MKTLIEFLEEAKKTARRRELHSLKTYINNLFSNNDIQIDFSNHFFERMNSRYLGDISLLKSIFRRFLQTNKDNLNSFIGKQIIISDRKSHINIPVVVTKNTVRDIIKIVVKTIIQKSEFKTPDPIISVQTEEFLHENQNFISDINTDYSTFNIKSFMYFR